jgi:polyhydroxyalkanoate synthase
MTAGLHADFVDLAMENQLVRPRGLTVLGVPIDLSAVTVDAYVVAGIADHITPWENCYRTTQLLGGKTRFVLSTSGHIAALVNPPGNSRATYHTNDDNPSDPTAWLHNAETHQGTWWADVADWLNARCGERKPAPESLGSPALPPLGEAPGTYVFDK